jgi:hypothetical protein
VPQVVDGLDLTGVQGLLDDPVDGAAVCVLEFVRDLLVGEPGGLEPNGLRAPPGREGSVAVPAPAQARMASRAGAHRVLEQGGRHPSIVRSTTAYVVLRLE